MSASTAIADVTDTLAGLLRAEQRNTDDPFVVTVESPATEGLTDNKINLYLFRIEENSFAKNREWQASGDEILYKAPLSLNLFYVLTPYTTHQVSGQKMLGEAMRILYDHAIIGPPWTLGSLEHTAEPLKVDLCAFNLEDITRVWNAFNVPYRLSVCYQVRIVFIDSAVEREAKRVLRKENRHEAI
jgi:hypothetical protein